jgi:hypothetical protein
MKKNFSIWLILALVAVFLVSSSAPAQDTSRINFTIKSVAAGVGFSWGNGFLIFQGQTYPIKVKGFSIITAGISSTNIVGTVFDLKDPADIAGDYRTLEAGAAVGVGVGRIRAKNDKGVTLELDAESKGVKVDLSAGSFTIALK